MLHKASHLFVLLISVPDLRGERALPETFIVRPETSRMHNQSSQWKRQITNDLPRCPFNQMSKLMLMFGSSSGRWLFDICIHTHTQLFWTASSSIFCKGLFSIPMMLGRIQLSGPLVSILLSYTWAPLVIFSHPRCFQPSCTSCTHFSSRFLQSLLTWTARDNDP